MIVITIFPFDEFSFNVACLIQMNLHLTLRANMADLSVLVDECLDSVRLRNTVDFYLNVCLTCAGYTDLSCIGETLKGTLAYLNVANVTDKHLGGLSSEYATLESNPILGDGQRREKGRDP